jgi:uncharacterized membrane protein
MNTGRKYWLDDPANVNRLYWLLVVVCVVLFAADFVIHRHVHFGWESFPGFYAIVGFVAFWCIVIAGKHLRKILWRPEDYYDD